MDQSPNIPSPFLRFYSMVGFAVLAYVVAWALTRRRDHRLAMRLGMAGAFVLSGVDHFMSTQSRYVPMLPDFMLPWGVPIVWGTGVAELLGAVGLAVPLALYVRLGAPVLRKAAGAGMALLLAGMMIANVNVAIKASAGTDYGFETWLYWLRLAFQLVFIGWALYSVELIAPRKPELAKRAP
jgi:uncharacterized membrane protein